MLELCHDMMMIEPLAETLNCIYGILFLSFCLACGNLLNLEIEETTLHFNFASPTKLESHSLINYFRLY